MNIADPYDGFSKVFDRVVSAPKYDKWEQWIKQVWKKHNFAPKSLLDLACGTGINSIKFAKENIEVFGIDSSPSMLDEARKKSDKVIFLNGHFLNFTIPKRVDAAICLDFSTNYILRQNEFVEFLNRVYQSLNNGGIFIFDCKPTNSFVKKEKHLKEKDFTFDWVCNIENAPFVIIDIKISLNNGSNFDERHIERGYSLEELKKIVQCTKFDLLEVYDDCQRKESNDKSELIQFVLKK